jgi:uncharacterized membrane protein
MKKFKGGIAMTIEIDILSIIIGCVIWELVRVYKDYVTFHIKMLVHKIKNKQEEQNQKDTEYKSTNIGIVASEQQAKIK